MFILGSGHYSRDREFEAYCGEYSLLNWTDLDDEIHDVMLTLWIDLDYIYNPGINKRLDALGYVLSQRDIDYDTNVNTRTLANINGFRTLGYDIEYREEQIVYQLAIWFVRIQPNQALIDLASDNMIEVREDLTLMDEILQLFLMKQMKNEIERRNIDIERIGNYKKRTNIRILFDIIGNIPDDPNDRMIFYIDNFNNVIG